MIITLPCDIWNAHRTRATVELLEKLQNLLDLYCDLQIHQIWIQLITACGKCCRWRCTKHASLICCSLSIPRLFLQISSCSLCSQRMMICLRTWYWWSQNISSIWLWCTTCNRFWNSLTSDCIDRHLSLLENVCKTYLFFYIYHMT